ncbi:sensor histidine kinase [Paenibacillus sp. IHBB 10380]|uniref:sensor histidine kinase n=1 Tax=Paenibacillus sp. IHBB 10380 TaxID=1566358 RepID=UPI0005CF9581|nr:HAMP domain-containing sensor histidine kinase [Paenibacillus sp. IHBB 10380]AJS57383.1 histidine kinase [Paenibacillus sp. IHBB 10380]
MKFVPKLMVIVIALISCSLALTLVIGQTSGGNLQKSTKTITEWQFKWGSEAVLNINNRALDLDEDWFTYRQSEPLPSKPSNTNIAWIKVSIPVMKWSNPAILISRIYGKHIVMSIDNKLIYESNRNYSYDAHKIVVPLNPSDTGKLLYIGIEAEKAKIGIHSSIILGDYTELFSKFVKQDIIDVIIGSAFIFIAVVMLICTIFITRNFVSSWVSLCVIILSTGILVLTYSSYLYDLYGNYGKTYTFLFDCALLIILPTVTYFFEKIQGNGYHAIISRYRKFQIAYSILCFVCMIVTVVALDKYHELNYFISVTLLGYTMIIQCLMLLVTLIIYAVKGNKDVYIFSIGIGLFTGTSLLDLIIFYIKSGNYEFILWKWGIVGSITILIIIIGRKFADSHEQIVKYSKEQELFNIELQRSEKMEIISELAASVAHEVRNPLQVSRGFIQLLIEENEQQQQPYLLMALEELDRASSIITDFLTFAEPEFDQVTRLNISKELRHIEEILLPLTNLQNGIITIDVPHDLYVAGNSSKFKQAFINMMKNSIEALNDNGDIRVWAYEAEAEVVIHIRDNGEGMDPMVISRLGEPYFSNKTKGTGLGLMVSYRIVEVMNGSITFTSEKGVGTEVIIKFPSIL